MIDTTTCFIEANTLLFKVLTDADAKAHINSLESPVLRDLAISLYKIEKVKRMMNKQNS